MKHELFFNQHFDCQECKRSIQHGFKYSETLAGERYVFEMVKVYTLVFILSGEALVSCNEFIDVRFSAGEMCLLPLNSNCVWKSLTLTKSIVLEGDNHLSMCDKEAIRKYANFWLNAVPTFQGLKIKPRLLEFLLSIKSYLEDEILCPHIHMVKQRELSVLLRAYYTPHELINFFISTVKNNNDFEWFVMNNYINMKGVKEFVDLSGMNLSAFNRKFKLHFKETPYQWLIKQKAKHIYYELCTSNRSFTSIAKEFHFADISHFDRYCKRIFGALPSDIRKKNMGKENNDSHHQFIDYSFLKF